MSDYELKLMKLRLSGASEDELYWFTETYGKSCKTCDYWQEIDESTGRCQYFYQHYLDDPGFYDYEEPTQQPITTNTGLCEGFCGYREGDLTKSAFQNSLSGLF